MGIFDNGLLDTVEWASPLSHYEPPDPLLPKHNAPLSPPAFTPVPRGEMDKREREKWEEVVLGGGGGEGGGVGGSYLSRCLI